MNFKSKQEAIKYYVDGGMTEEDAKKLVDSNAKTKSLPDKAEAGKVQVIKAEEVLKDYQDLSGKTTSLESEIKELNTKVEDLSAENKAVKEELAKRKSEVSVNEKDDLSFGYKSIEEFAKDTFLAAKSGEKPEKLKKMGETLDNMKAVGSPTASTFVDEDGGFLIPTEFSPELLKIEKENGDFYNRARQIDLGTNSLTVPTIDGFDESSGVLFGNVVALWRKELDELTAKNPKFGEVTLKLNKLTGLAYVSDEMMEDSPVSVNGMLTDLFGQAMAYAKDKAMISGSGAGQPLGILNSPAKITVSANGAANTILAQDVIDMYVRAHGRDEDLVWIANRNTLPQLYLMTVDVGTGGGIVWMPGNSMAGGLHQSMLGIPIIFSDHAKSLGTEGDLMLVNWKQYLWGKKSGGGVKAATSIHLKFDFDQVAFRITERVDGQVWWKSARTPENGSTTSPIVTLATRS